MVIKILGTGCRNCKTLFNTVNQAVNELEIEASVVKEEDILKIIGYNVLGLPSLVIDEKVVSVGKNLSLSEVKDLLTK